MPNLDIAKFLERSGVRRTRLGGLVEEDVRAALQALCNEYEQRLARAEAEVRRLGQENAALQQQCRTLAGQNRTLSGQNATLAGSSEKFSRQNQDLDTQLSNMKARNHSLNDQCAVLKLKNNDLTRENAALQDRAQQAETALRLRTEELQREKASLAANREKLLAAARQEAEDVAAAAKKDAADVLDAAREKAEAIEQAAKTQARQQAQALVDAASAEANEIQNAHHLRLNEMKNELRRLELRRDRLVEFLSRWGNELLRSGDAVQAGDPDAEELPPLPEQPLDWTAEPAPQAELDFSPDVLESTIAALRGQAEGSVPEVVPGPEPEPEPAPEPEPGPEPDPVPMPEPEPVPVPEPEPELAPEPAPAPAMEDSAGEAEDSFLLDADGIWGMDPLAEAEAQAEAGAEEDGPAAAPAVRQTGPALTEVPGAIFSSPIVQRAEAPAWDEVPLTPGPHMPVLPNVAEEEDDFAPGTVPIQPPAARSISLRRRKAVWAVRALRRLAQ